MFTRNFLIAVLVSLAVHLVWMTAIGIKTSSDLCRDKIYTQIEFLGPILGKTTFDIMIERSDPYNVSYRSNKDTSAETMLNLENEKQEFNYGEEVPSYDKYFGNGAYKSLRSAKAVPDVILEKNFTENPEDVPGRVEGDARNVVFRPEPPYIRKGDYGSESLYTVRFNVLVSSYGNVKMADIFTSTGYPEVDAAALEYIKGWVFEPAGSYPYGEDEWMVVDVAIQASGD